MSGLFHQASGRGDQPPAIGRVVIVWCPDWNLVTHGQWHGPRYGWRVGNDLRMARVASWRELPSVEEMREIAKKAVA